MDNPTNIVKYVFSAVGSVCLILFIVLSITTIQFIARATTATGTVVSYETTRGESGTMYKPVVQFKTVDGKTISFTSKVGSSSRSYDYHQEVKVLYDPESPGNASIKSFLGLWFLPMILGILGCVSSAIGFGIILHGKKNRLGAFLKSIFGPSVKAYGEWAMVSEQGLIDVWYSPDKKHTNTEDEFLFEVARFGGNAMREMGLDKECKQINIWIEGRIPAVEDSSKRKWKGVKLVLDKSNRKLPAIGDLSNLASNDRAKYFSLCSLQYVSKHEFPNWPKDDEA